MKNREIDHGQAFDWGLASEEYAKYRDIYPPAFYSAITGGGLCTAGQTVLDLGTGTGVLPRALYGQGAAFVGADAAENQIIAARALSRREGKDIRYVVAPAEDLDFPDDSFDVVTAAQCFFYFDEARLLPKLARMLKPKGHVLIAYMMWLPEESEVVKKSEELVLRHNPGWTGGGYVRVQERPSPLMERYFATVGRQSFDVELPFSREGWHGRMLACRGIGAAHLAPNALQAFEEEHLAMLEAVPQPMNIPHHVRMLHLQKKD